jgi:uncharacterized membrane protein YeaQ/YmgE (transglycosylase-associated protein family)
MPTPLIGLLVGVLLAIAAITGGFGGFLLAVVLGAVGYLVAGQLSGKLDLVGLLAGRNRG